MAKVSERVFRFTLIWGKPYAWVDVDGRLELVPVRDVQPQLQISADTEDIMRKLSRAAAEIYRADRILEPAPPEETGLRSLCRDVTVHPEQDTATPAPDSDSGHGE